MAWGKKLMNSWNSRTRLKCHVNTVLFFFLNDLVPWNRFERWRSEEALPRQGWACLSLEDKGCTVSWGLYRATIITGGVSMGKHGREELVTGTRADKHRSRRHVSDWNDNRVPPVSWLCTPLIVSDLQVQTGLEEKEEDLWTIELFLDFFFFGFGDYWKNRSL